MRKDLDKQVRKISNTRHCVKVRDPKWNGDEDSVPRRQSMHHRESDNRKHSHTNGKVFMRVLEKQVGRPWDKIYSELSSIFPKSHDWHNLVGWYVELNAVMHDGQVMVHNAHTGYMPLEAWGRHVLYVCPKTGLLKKLPSKSRKYKHTKYEFITVSEYEQIHKIFGIWYLLKLENEPVKKVWRWKPVPGQFIPPLDKTVAESRIGNERYGHWVEETPYSEKDAAISSLEVSAMVTNGPRPWGTWGYDLGFNHDRTKAFFYGRPGVRAVSKKQLSHRELKRHKLENDPLQMYTCVCGYRCFTDARHDFAEKMNKCPGCGKEMKIGEIC